jgi:hypothetical protein
LPDEELQHTLSAPVQAQPDMIEKKRIVIIDTAQRDWTIQPDAYSNIFAFGSQQPVKIDGPQVPYYFNNPTIPLDAYETPLSLLNVGPGSGSLNDIPATANNKRQTFPAGVTPPTYLNRSDVTVYPTYGWKLVYLNGQLIHSPTAFSYTDPNVQVFYYPVYDSREPAGAQIGIDLQPKRYGINEYIFSTQLIISNITDIKLARATLPVRALQTYKPTTFSTNIQYSDSFHSKPYLLMSIQNLRGQYYGGGQVVQNSFAALVQDSRTLYDGNAILPAQFSDYHQWSDESYKFNPPLAKLSNANIQLFTGTGQQFSQHDNLNVIDIQLLDGSNFGKSKFFVTQTILNTTSGFTDLNTILKSDIRVGDEISFYRPSITQIASDPSSSMYMTQYTSLLSNNFIVTDVCDKDFPTQNIFPIADVATSFTAVPKIQGGYAGLSNAYATMSGLMQTISGICLQQYTNVTQSNLSFAQARTFSQDFVIPMMNTNLQATYAFEITSLEPDSKKLKKIIPN